MKKTFAEMFASAENTVEYWREGCELLDAECKRLRGLCGEAFREGGDGVLSWKTLNALREAAGEEGKA